MRKKSKGEWVEYGQCGDILLYRWRHYGKRVQAPKTKAPNRTIEYYRKNGKWAPKIVSPDYIDEIPGSIAEAIVGIGEVSSRHGKRIC